ncbi:type VI secretion system accessory protein TagJ [Desulfococcus sp.]|uniref:type VI secretion system accessory protein TagJ n=1 Tax=Desulfococcus sp. TaxID=2025834 RepID=UPI003593127E
MTDPRELINAGKLAEARQALVEGVRRSPADAAMRTILFQVLILFGEWDKALKQADIIAAQNVRADIGVQVYKNLIAAERERSEVNGSGGRPSFLPKAPPYAEVYFSALAALEGGDMEGAEADFNAADGMRAEISGTRDGAAFAGFTDTDSRLAFFLEAFVHERYAWIPFDSVRELVIAPPGSLFDLIWATARITAWDGLTLNCFLPVIYPGSHAHPDDRIKMGRMTDWQSLGGSFYRGQGQHVYQIGDADVPILEIGEILFGPPGPPSEGVAHD